MNKQKNMISTVLLSVILFVCLGFVAMASEKTPPAVSTKEDGIVTDTKDLLCSVYLAKDTCRDWEFTENQSGIDMTDEVYEYLSDKIEIHNYVIKNTNAEKTDYKVGCRLLEKTETDDRNITMKFCVSAAFKYANIEVDPYSEYTEEVTVVYDSREQKITSVTAPEDYYDVTMESYAKESDTQKSVSKKTRLKNSIDNVTLKENSVVPNINNAKTGQQYPDSASVVSYAAGNYNKTNPSSGKTGVSYYDFATISGSYDCTNFVSHALLAGGAKMKYTSNGWYYTSLSSRAPAWSSVGSLRSYISSNTTLNTLGGTISLYNESKKTNGTGCVKCRPVPKTEKNVIVGFV